MATKIIILLSMILISFSSESKACSIAIDEDQTSNYMIAQAANQFNIPLTKTYQMKSDDFTYQLYGEHPTSSCSNHLEFTSNITIKYKPNFLEVCELTVEVVYTQNLNAETFPFESFQFNTPASSCRRIPITINPRRPTIRKP